MHVSKTQHVKTILVVTHANVIVAGLAMLFPSVMILTSAPMLLTMNATQTLDVIIMTVVMTANVMMDMKAMVKHATMLMNVEPIDIIATSMPTAKTHPVLGNVLVNLVMTVMAMTMRSIRAKIFMNVISLLMNVLIMLYALILKDHIHVLVGPDIEALVPVPWKAVNVLTLTNVAKIATIVRVIISLVRTVHQEDSPACVARDSKPKKRSIQSLAKLLGKSVLTSMNVQEDSTDVTRMLLVTILMVVTNVNVILASEMLKVSLQPVLIARTSMNVQNNHMIAPHMRLVMTTLALGTVHAITVGLELVKTVQISMNVMPLSLVTPASKMPYAPITTVRSVV
jgi:hypothetical protein